VRGHQRAGSPDDIWGPALRPDERETAQLLAELDWRMDWYNASWRDQMRQRPLDIDSGTNTVIFQKRGENDWCFRRASFTMVPPRTMPAETLEQVLDRVNDYGGGPNPKWRAWKAAHPEAFSAVAIDGGPGDH
jgi:hypothetical protein